MNPRTVRIAASLSVCILTLAMLPAQGQTVSSDNLSSQEVLSRMASVAQTGEQDILSSAVDILPNEDLDNVLEVSLSGTDIEVPADISSPVTVQESLSEKVLIHRPYDKESTQAEVLGNGTVVNEGDTFSTVTSIKEDGGLQLATIIDSVDTPERFSYSIELPEDAHMFETHGGVLIEDADGNLIGGFTPPWALDAKGRSVPTRYEVEGNTLTQVVSHKEEHDVQYPVVADPVFRHGMIHSVIWERWNRSKGGWELRLQVTGLARWYQPFNPSYVMSEGLKDLRANYPNSMIYGTMAQQWECHVVGLPRTINIDLESYRRSWPGWRSGILGAIIRGNPDSACNW